MPRAVSILPGALEPGDFKAVDDSRHSFRHLDLKHLRQLSEVADKGSIRAAAESLAITQPALSRSIRSIENELGLKLVEPWRAPRGDQGLDPRQQLQRVRQSHQVARAGAAGADAGGEALQVVSAAEQVA